MFTLQKELFMQLFRKAFTNKFPVKHVPDSVTKLLKDVEEGKTKLNPPVPVEKDYRGKIKYYRNRCIGCQLCTKVCPAAAVVFLPKTKKIKYHVFRCTFCGECVRICPVKALEFTPEFLLADYKMDSE